MLSWVGQPIQTKLEAYYDIQPPQTVETMAFQSVSEGLAAHLYKKGYVVPVKLKSMPIEV